MEKDENEKKERSKTSKVIGVILAFALIAIGIYVIITCFVSCATSEELPLPTPKSKNAPLISVNNLSKGQKYFQENLELTDDAIIDDKEIQGVNEDISDNNEEEFIPFYEGDPKNLTPPELTNEMLLKESESTTEPLDTLLPNQIKESTISVERKNDFSKSIAVYDFQDGFIYTIYTSPGNATDIRLEEGEELTADPIVGDANQWQFLQATSVENNISINHIFVRPNIPQTSTNVVFVTNKRTYYLKLVSFQTIYMIGVRFRYPLSSVASFGGNNVNNNKLDITLTNLEDLDFDFIVQLDKKQTKPTWTPSNVYTDGKRTFIQLSPYFVNTLEAPTIYFLNDYKKENDMSVINYRLKGNLYITDLSLRRGQALLLISGKDKVKVVKL